MVEDPTNMELMRILKSIEKKSESIEEKSDAQYNEIMRILWGPNKDNGLVTAVSALRTKVAILCGGFTATVVGILGAIINHFAELI